MSEGEVPGSELFRSLIRRAHAGYWSADAKWTEAILSRLPSEAFPDANQTTYRVVYSPPAQCLAASYPDDPRIVPTIDYGSELLQIFRTIKEVQRSPEAQAAIDQYISMLMGPESIEFVASFMSAFVMQIATELAELLSLLREFAVALLGKPIACFGEGLDKYFEQLDRAMSAGDLNLQLSPVGLDDGPACQEMNAVLELLSEIQNQIVEFQHDPIAFMKAKAPGALKFTLMLVLESDVRIIEAAATPQEAGAFMGSLSATIVMFFLP